MITRTAHGKSLTGGFQRSPSEQTCGLVDVAKQGRNGDTQLAHINEQEAQLLKQHGGSGTINPNTGLPEYGITDSGRGSSVSSIDNDRSGLGGGFEASPAATGGFYPGLNPELGPNAREGREFIERAQPSAFERFVGRLPGAAMPGVKTEMRPNYIAGEPELVASLNPIGAAASFMNPLGFDPKGDLMSPGFADIELGATKRSDPYEEGAGKGGAFEETPRWRQMADNLIQGVLRGPQLASNTPYVNTAIEG